MMGMTPDERAEEMLTNSWAFAAMDAAGGARFHDRIKQDEMLFARHVREAEAAERKRCLAIMRVRVCSGELREIIDGIANEIEDVT